MERFYIAGLQVDMNCPQGLMYDRSRKYLGGDSEKKADITVDLTEAFTAEKHKKFPQLTLDECRYVWSGELFYTKLLEFDGLLLHSSAAEKDGRAYLFSAKSGTGKSTHTHLWQKYLDNVSIINDDKPAVRKINGKFYACGTPFSGKNDESENRLVPVRAIVFIERAADNSIEPITPKEAIPLFMSQTVRPYGAENMSKMLSTLSEILTQIPVFKLKCNISEEAVRVSYGGIEEYINGEKHDED